MNKHLPDSIEHHKTIFGLLVLLVFAMILTICAAPASAGNPVPNSRKEKPKTFYQCAKRTGICIPVDTNRKPVKRTYRPAGKASMVAQDSGPVDGPVSVPDAPTAPECTVTPKAEIACSTDGKVSVTWSATVAGTDQARVSVMYHGLQDGPCDMPAQGTLTTDMHGTSSTTFVTFSPVYWTNHHWEALPQQRLALPAKTCSGPNAVALLDFSASSGGNESSGDIKSPGDESQAVAARATPAPCPQCYKPPTPTARCDSAHPWNCFTRPSPKVTPTPKPKLRIILRPPCFRIDGIKFCPWG